MRQNEHNHNMEELLEQALEAPEQGQSFEGLLSSHANAAQEITAMLSVASQVRSALTVSPNEEAKTATRFNVLSHAAQRRSAPWTHFFFTAFMLRPAAAVGIALLLLAVGSTSAVVASASALPGEPLYPVKTSWEQVQIALTFDEMAKGQAQAHLAQRRTEEIAQLADQGRGVPSDAVVRMSAQTETAMAGMAKGQDLTALSQQLADITERQQQVLERVAKAAPESAQPALERALEVSRSGHQKAQEAIETSRERQGRGSSDKSDKSDKGDKQDQPDGGGRATPERQNPSGATATATPQRTQTPVSTAERGKTARPTVTTTPEEGRSRQAPNADKTASSDNNNGKQNQKDENRAATGQNDNKGGPDLRRLPEEIIDRVREALGIGDRPRQQDTERQDKQEDKEKKKEDAPRREKNKSSEQQKKEGDSH